MVEGGRRFPVRISGYFSPEQQKRLDKAAWKQRKTVAEVLRELVDTLPVAK